MNLILKCPLAKGLALLVALSVQTLHAQTVWNPTTDFSIVAGNPNGVWTYGGMDVGFVTFTPFVSISSGGGFNHWYTNPQPAVGFNGGASTSFGVPPGYLTLHPGPGTEPAVLRWTTPNNFTGTIDVDGQFLAGDGGSMLLAIRRGVAVLWSGTDSGVFDLSSLAVVPGDTLDFAVYGGYAFGNTPLELTITGIPEPATHAAVAGMVALGLAMYRRRAASL